jgi:ATP-dependent Clp protease protease subunit
VLGLAASAASIIAMAGDEIQIARAGFLMVHNTWVMAMGNRHDLRDIADMLEPFDLVMADIYAARTGMDPRESRRRWTPRRGSTVRPPSTKAGPILCCLLTQ